MSARKIEEARGAAQRPEPTESMPVEYATSDEHRTMRITPKQSAPGTRVLANEVPVALEFDGSPYAVMMLTPADLEDFAVGFALSERIIVRKHEIARIDVRFGTRGIGIDVHLEKEHSARLAERRRPIPVQSGSGICW